MSTTRTPKLLVTPGAALAAALIVTACAATGERDEPISEDPADRAVSYTVQRGDRLGDIAFELTGDLSKWRDIAEINGIDDPRKLREGVVLHVPASLIPSPADDIASREPETAPAVEPARHRRSDAAPVAFAVKRMPVTLSPVVVNRDFELSPLGAAAPGTPPAQSNPVRRIKVVGSYFPKGIYAQPAVYSKLLMRVAPGTLFELEREVEDWYGIITDQGIGYLRDVDGRVLDAPDAGRG